MKYLFSILLVLCIAPNGWSQVFTVKGSIADTMNSIMLHRASVVLVRTSDSAIESYARSRPDGSFEIKAAAKGKYIFRVTFPGFADYVDVININAATTDLGVLPMISKTQLLQTFVITRQLAAIKIKGDTTEYVADSFKVREGATVEDLLKRLPGIQVDKNGQITAQGETVQKILVDGEEFFSDDPKVVTQGLQSNVVDKVQVFDKKSDQAEFTGIDDGQKTKTINLQLKENSKKGYFGKIDVGAGTDQYYQEQAMLNAFEGKRQISVFGIFSNTDKIGLSWQDKDKFSSGNGSTEITDDGGTITTWNNSDEDFGGWDGKYSGEGLPQTATAGVHFADKWNDDKSHIATNYRYGQQQVDIAGNTTTLYKLNGDSSNISNMAKTQYSKTDRHAFDIMYEWKIDTNNSLKLSMDAGYKTGQTKSVYNTITTLGVADALIPLYTNNRTITSTSTAEFINADLLYRKKFSKKGRTLSIDVKENYKDSKSDGTLVSDIVPDSANAVNTAINQRKENNTNTLAFAAKATYTEPLSKVTFLEFNYGTTVNNSDGKNLSFNNNTILDDTFSSNYRYNILSNSGGLNFRFVYKKVNFSFGGNIANSGYLQTDLLHGDTTHTYNYVNFFPQFNFKYKLNKQSAINFYYNGSSEQPTIAQIQPLRQNTDPTNITIGNPNLKQEFIHKLRFTYNDYKVLTHRWLWLSLNTTFTSNAISTSLNNSEGINTTQFVNVNGNYSGYAWLGAGFKLPKPDVNIGFHFNPTISHTNSFINGQKNTNDNNSYEAGLDFSYYKENKYDIGFSPAITYYDNKATVSAYTTNYWQSSSEFSSSVQLPLKFYFSTNIAFLFRQPTPVFTSNNNVVKWNATIGKKLLKKGGLEIKASVYDILNQNIGYDRTAQGNIITQNSYNTIRRYGMLSLVWNFSHKPGENPEPDVKK